MNVKKDLKVLLRSRSLQFMRDSRPGRPSVKRHVYRWRGLPVSYRPNTSDPGLIYNILLKRGAKGEYSVPRDARLDPASVGVVLDIGANIGIAALYFAQVFPNAVVHSFEPEPGNCEVLRLNAAATGRVQVHGFALGAEDGELTLFHSDSEANLGGFSSHRTGIDPDRSVLVPVRHAGRALAELGVTRADVIKIDTEGAEWEILTSLDPALLGSVHLVMGELHGRRDFALLDYLQPNFHIAVRKNLRNRLFNFYAVNRRPA